ncbi:MAG: type VI secretion system baseplate subunit TssF, partial [Desulfamplus sp.]|nr:type VI secretion system baseplate subunit TssF [Desulfamplus sp.]
MDKKFLHYYNLELQYLREMGEEFALENPKIAGRLGLSQFGCADPYVERLLEGFAYLSARVHYKLDEEFPRFIHSILNTVYPQYLMPTPSMAMVRFDPDLSETDLAEGFTIPRNTVLKSVVGKDDRTACEFRTAHDVTLWPLEIEDAVYEIGYRDTMDFGGLDNARSSLRIRLKTSTIIPFAKLELDALPFYIRDTNNNVPMRIYELIFASCIGVVIQSTDDGSTFKSIHEDVKNEIKQVGFSKDESLFPYDPRTFQGYRLLREYFAFPNRFMFFELSNLKESFKQSNQHELDIIFVFNKADYGLDKKIIASNFDLFCTPVINLFSKRTDRIHLSKGASEFHVVPDRTRTLDYEVMHIDEVLGYGPDSIAGDAFLPFYACADFDDIKGVKQTYYTNHRIPRSLTKKEIEQGPRSLYIGSEVYITLVDANDTPYNSELRELGLKILCSNRDLPTHIPLGTGKSDFTLDINV